MWSIFLSEHLHFELQFQRYLARLVVESGTDKRKTHMLRRDRMCPETKHRSRFNSWHSWHSWEGESWEEKKNFNLTSNNYCIPTPLWKLEMTNLCDPQLLTGQDKTRHDKTILNLIQQPKCMWRSLKCPDWNHIYTLHPQLHEGAAWETVLQHFNMTESCLRKLARPLIQQTFKASTYKLTQCNNYASTTTTHPSIQNTYKHNQCMDQTMFLVQHQFAHWCVERPYNLETGVCLTRI